MTQRGSRHGRMHTPNHAALWATLTIAAFPIVALSLSWAGVGPFRSFVAGAAATLLILLIEALVRQRWWFSDPAIQKIIQHPHVSLRLLAIVGICVLIFQTMVLAGFLTNTAADAKVTRLILQRQCGSPTDPLFVRLCQVAKTPELPTATDVMTMAVREAAMTRFFSGGLVTCAVRPKLLECDMRECRQAAALRCDQWQVGKITRMPVSIASVQKPVVALLELTESGTYRVNAWSDDPTSPGWQAVGGDLDGRAPETVSPLDTISLQIETFRRVVERLTSR